MSGTSDADDDAPEWTYVWPTGTGFPTVRRVCCSGEIYDAQGSFCSRCGNPLPDFVAPDPATVPDPQRLREPQTARVESALRHTLRDVEDGHIGLWGEPGSITVDRVIDPRLSRLDWVALMLHRGWIAQAHGHRTLRVTPAGYAVLAETAAPPTPASD